MSSALRSDAGRGGPMAALARAIGCTEGQAYTVAIGIVVAAVLAGAGVPAALRTRAVTIAAPLSTPAPRVRTVSRPPAAAASGPAPVAPAITGETPAPAPDAAPFPGVAAPAAASPATNGVPAATGPPPAPSVAVGTVSTFARVGSPGAPGGLAVGPDGSVWVTTDNGTSRGVAGPSHLFGFASTGAPAADVAITGQRSGHADGLAGVAVAPNGAVVVVDVDSARIVEVDRATGRQVVLTTLPDLAPCIVDLGARPCEPGVEDHHPAPVAAAFDARGDLFVTDAGQATIWRLRPGSSTPDAWYQSTDFATGDGPSGLGFDPHGRLLFTVGSSLDVATAGAGGLYALAIASNGSAGGRSLVASFASGAEPGGLAIGASGAAYVVLRKAQQVVAVTPGGTHVLVTAPGGGAIPIDGPSAVAVTAGKLLIANRATTNDPAHWAVLAVAVDDGPVTY